MMRKEKLRRVLILCCHCLRNLSFYRAGWEGNKPIFHDQFWVNVNNNFLDIFVLEWCKLFGDRNGKHYWAKIVSIPDNFFKNMLEALEIKQEQFEALKSEMKTYRDKFVAHLDSEKTMYIPNNLILAQRSTQYLYNHIKANEYGDNYFNDAPKSANEYYDTCFRIGKSVYEEIK